MTKGRGTNDAGRGAEGAGSGRLPSALRARLLGGSEQAVMAAAAALLAYGPPAFFRLPESFWAAITAIAVVQNRFSATRSTARDQAAGAALGGCVGLAADIAFGDNLAVYAAAVALAIVAAWLLNAPTAARLAGTTTTIILLVPHAGTSPERIMLARVGEVAWGVTAALGVVAAGAWVIARVAGPPSAQ